MFSSPTAWAALYGSAAPAPPQQQHSGADRYVREEAASAAAWATRTAVPDSSYYTVASQPVRCFPPPPLPVVRAGNAYAADAPRAPWPPLPPPGPPGTTHGTERSYATAAAAAGHAPGVATPSLASPYASERPSYPRSGAAGMLASPLSTSYRFNTAAARAIAVDGPHGTTDAYAYAPQLQQPWPPPPPPAVVPLVDHYANYGGVTEPTAAAAPAAWWPPQPSTTWCPQQNVWPSSREPAHRGTYPDHDTRDGAAAIPAPHHVSDTTLYAADAYEGGGAPEPPPAHPWQTHGTAQDPAYFPPPPLPLTREDRGVVWAGAPPLAPLQQQHQQHQQESLASPLVCSSISDGARHLNSVRHRSAASAAAFFFFSASPTTGAAEGGGGGGGGCGGGAGDPDRSPHGSRARRHARHGGADVGAFASATTDPLLSVSSTTAAAAAQADPCCVAALIFNTAKEVGVALCELPSLTVSLLQYGDTATFFKTTSLLHSRNPVEVLVPVTAVDSELVQTLLRQHGAHMTFTSVQRCFYNSEEGVQRLLTLRSTPEAALCIEDTDRYLCVAAANAVVLYMEHVNDMHLMPGSVRVRAEALEHYMELSRTTARTLQVIPDGACTAARAVVVSPMPPTSHPTSDARRGAARFTLRPGHDFADPSPPPPTLQAVALVDVIPRACTIMGQRYLRRTLLQPLRDRVAVQGRHDAVEWLLCEPRRLYALRTLLRHTAALDLERLTATLTHQPRRKRTAAQIQAYLESLQLLWSALPYLAQLQAQLESYLGPPPADTSELDGTEPDTPRDARASTLGVSTPQQPAVLRSIAVALAQCRFDALSRRMGDYLERSVLPSVVQQHEQSGRHYGALHHGEAERRQQQLSNVPTTSKRGRQRRQSGGGAVTSSASSSSSTTSLLQLLRVCFLVQAPRGGELDALRTRLSVRVSDITTYAMELRAALQMSSLRLEPDPAKLYCLSYLAAEEAKAQAGPFTWRYAGGSHFSLFLAALRERQLAQQRQHLHRGCGSQEGCRPASDASGNASASTESSALNVSTEASMLHRLSLDGHHHREHRHHHSDADASSMLSPLGATALDAGAVSDSTARQRRRRRVRCGTEDLEYRCARAQECVAAVLQLQVQAVQPLVSSIQRDFLGVLQATVESVALLDTLLSFALYSLTHHCTRPVLVELRTGMTTAPCALPEAARASEAEAEAEALALAAAGTALRREENRVGSAQAAESTCRGARPPVAQERRHSLHGERCDTDSSDASQDAASVKCTHHLDTTAAASTDSSSSHLHTLSSPSTSDAVHEIGTDDARAPPHDDNDDARDNAQSAAVTVPRCSVFVLDGLHPSATSTTTTPGAAFHPRQSSAHASLSHTAQPSGGLTLSWGCDGFVCVITGPNACGKTTLLRLLGQYLTLAQAGCFVPARHAHLFLADRLLAHMLCDELPSITQSSFRRELMELNDVTHAATGESVVLIDELGRSTTTAQGFSLAWATAMYLSERGVHAVLTTHYAGLPSLARVRPHRVVTFHFRVAFQEQPHEGMHSDQPPREGVAARADAAAEDAATAYPTRRRMTIVRFGHTLFPGPCPQQWYGLALAERLHFFEPVLALAQRLGRPPRK